MRLGGQRGSAAVEMAVLAPVLCALVFFLVHLEELGLAGVAQEEMTRYVAWELTARQLSDFGSVEARHDRRFEDAARAVVDEARKRFSDLSPQDREARPIAGFATRLGGPPSITIEPAGLGAKDAVKSDALSGIADALGSLMAGPLDRALGTLCGLDTRGASARVSVSLSLEDRLLPRSLLPDSLAKVTLQPSTTLLGVDTWSLPDGSDVHLPGGSGDRGQPLYIQVQRMHLFRHALEDALGSATLGALDAASAITPVHLFQAQVVAENYTLPGKDPSPMGCNSVVEMAAPGMWRNHAGYGYGGNTAQDRMSAETCFDTLPLLAVGPFKRYEDDPLYQALAARGERYMGCKEDDPDRDPQAGCR